MDQNDENNRPDASTDDRSDSSTYASSDAGTGASAEEAAQPDVAAYAEEAEQIQERWRREQAAFVAQARQRGAAEGAWWAARAAGHQDETLRQDNLMYAGLIGIGVVLVQPFLTPGPRGLDLTAAICVIAFSVAIPLLAGLVVLNSHEVYRRRPARSGFVQVARQSALGAGMIGTVAGFWHITPIAGIGTLVAGVLALSVYTVGYQRLERDVASATATSPDQPKGPSGPDQPSGPSGPAESARPGGPDQPARPDRDEPGEG